MGRMLGTGGSCIVRLAQDHFGNKYAMKILNAGAKFDAEIKAEIETLMTIKHPHIVNFVESGVAFFGNAI